MRFGLSLPNHGEYGDVRKIVELAVLAEEAEWDGFFLWDHFARGVAPQIDPWIAMSSIASHTKRMCLGMLITPITRRRPWKVAREIVTLDHLSNGRMVLGVGLGDFQRKEFSNFGEVSDPITRGEMLDEGLEIIAGLQSGEKFGHEGRHYKIEETVFNPKPVQRPRVPIWVAGKWPNKRPFRRAAQWDGVVPIHRSRNIKAALTVDEMVEIKHFIQQHRTTDTPFDYCVSGVLPTEGRNEHRALIQSYAEAGATWWIEFVYSATGSFAKNTEHIRCGPPRQHPRS
ncbi:MAG: LLM class flavin-dependent oxidoreductase [Anaerolineales bacterium]|jgi:alkanesulfonate monooxygenase SsuD/methylene tetrahydromethanopterin reductase-like flavin-dependent oxidoreductase (luciferase family)